MGSTAVADPLVGTLLDGRYRVDRMLARGGMSTVYAGTDLRLDRRVAVKVMAPALAHDPAFTDRFVREARTAARLSHPNAVSVFDQGAQDTAGGRVVFLVMELVPGGTVRDVLRQRGRLRPDEAVSLLEPVLAALAAAHRAGLVHRDVKPENVLITPDGAVKVVDFGLARAVAAPSTSTQAGVVLGTVAYVAPEQVTRGAADPRTDVYAAGIMLFELLTGMPPYAGDAAIAVAYRHVHDDVPPPSDRVPGIPPALDELVQRATRREPGARPTDAGALLAELALVRADLALRIVPPHELAPHPAPAGAGGPGAGRPAAAGGPGAVVGVAAGIGTGGSGAAGGAAVRSGPDHPGAGPGRRTGRPGPGGPGGGRAGGAGAGGPGGVGAGGPGALWVAPGTPGATGVLAPGGPPRSSTIVIPGGPPRGPGGPAGGRGPDVGWAAERRVRRRRAWLALATVLALTLTVGGAAWWFGSGRFAVVPALADLTRQDATARVQAADLEAAFRTEPSESVAEGRVIRSDPAAGDRVLRGRTVTVVLSSGPPLVAVPGVAGLPRADAEAAVRGAGLVVTVTERPSEEVERGLVVSQQPAGGEVRRGSTVRLVVSTGRGLVRVPDVRGRSVDQARRELEEAGFKVRVRSLRIGNVVLQQPGPGTERKRGSTVTIWGL